MRLYICIDGSYAGTQADANAKGRGWTQEEVPTDKAGLLAYLNGMVDEHRATQSLPAVPATDRAATSELRSNEPTGAFTASQIEEFILDRASVGEVEAIFACLGTRFAELRK